MGKIDTYYNRRGMMLWHSIQVDDRNLPISDGQSIWRGGLSIAEPSSKRSDNLHHVLMHFLNTRIRIDDMNE